jgi:hypothetical protein
MFVTKLSNAKNCLHALDPSKVDVLETLKSNEKYQQGEAKSQQTTASLALLANEGVELEAAWFVLHNPGFLNQNTNNHHFQGKNKPNQIK